MLAWHSADHVKHMRYINVAALILFVALTALAQSPSERLRAMGDFFVTNYNASAYGAIQERFNGQMNAAVPPDKLAAFLDGLHKDLGRLVSIGTPNMIGAGAARF